MAWTPTIAMTSLHGLDWLVLGGYVALLVVSGVWLGRKRIAGAEEYFLAARHMPAWAVGVSILATSLSAATFIGVPERSYDGDLTYLSTYIGMGLAAIVLAVWFIPAFYRHRVQTIYGLLEVRYGPRAKNAASATFMLGRVLASGARIYLGALPASIILFGDLDSAHVMLAIGGLAVVAVGYTLIGGIASVIWADVIQTGVFLVAVVAAIIVLLARIDAGPGEIVQTLSGAEDGSKLSLVSLSADPSQAFTLWSAVIAFTVIGIGSYGTDHDLAQRMLTCKSAAASGRAAIGAILGSVPTVALFLVIGLLLFIYFENPGGVAREGALGYEVDDTRQVFLQFIVHEMPPGLTGLMLAGLFAAGLSSLNSALNAMSSTLISDFYRPMVSGRSEGHYVVMGRLAVVMWGVVLGLFACVCVEWQQRSELPLLDFALSVMLFAYAGLVAVFLAAIFTRRGNATSVIAALIAGFVAVLAMNPIGLGLAEVLPRLVGFEDVVIAWPWYLPIGVVVAFGVVVLGRSMGVERGRAEQDSRMRAAAGGDEG